MHIKVQDLKFKPMIRANLKMIQQSFTSFLLHHYKNILQITASYKDGTALNQIILHVNE